MERTSGLELRILGAVDAVTATGRIDFSGTKPRTALATLLLAGGRPVQDARLGAMLWGTRPPATAGAQLHTYMSRLRAQLGEPVRIVRQANGYALHLDAASLDHTEFERRAARGQDLLAAGRHDEAATELAAAVALWRGRALGDVTTFLAEAEGPRLEESRIAALEARIEAELALGRHDRLVPELTTLVAENPLRERLRAQLMTALYRNNRQAEALGLYDSGRQLLADELGVAPGPVLDQAFHAILRGEPRPPAQVKRAASRPAMLPADVSDFTGRAAELAALESSADHRFVVTGMAGVGKTALAVRAAHAQLADFPDGQLHVDLGGAEGAAKDPAEVLAWFLRALGVDDVPATVDERAQVYRSRLAGRHLLVLLDNADTGSQVAPLLPGTPTCRVLVTSRRPLTVLAGARTVPLTPMSDVDGKELLAKLIGERADADPGAVQHLGELCGGLPLALRIVGARLIARPDWPVSRLADRISRTSILDELVQAELTVRDRLEADCRRLSAAQLSALRRLSTLDVPELPVWAAARVLTTSPDAAATMLDELIDACLVQPAVPDANGQPRYRIHPLVRELVRDLDLPAGAVVPRAAAGG